MKRGTPVIFRNRLTDPLGIERDNMPATVATSYGATVQITFTDGLTIYTRADELEPA